MLARRGALRGLWSLLAIGACRSSGSSRAEPGAAGGSMVGAEPASAAVPASPVGHALVVGGTGMLAEASLGIAHRGYTTTVIARRPGPLAALAERGEGRVHPLAVDYTDPAALRSGLEDAMTTRGPLTLVVAWVHSSAPEAPLAIATLAASAGPVRYIHLLGSAADDPSAPDPRRRASFEAIDGVTYQEVILGFMIEDGDSRWLSDEEIVAGVLRAVDERSVRHIVGVTRPWSARP